MTRTILSILMFSINLQICTDLYAEEKSRAGGACEYKQYKGQARITSVLNKTNSNKGSDKYEVRFEFIPEEQVKEIFAQTEGKTFELLLANSSYPEAVFLRKYGIEVGKSFACSMKVIVKGTCSPVLFDFPNINIGDTSESTKH